MNDFLPFPIGTIHNHFMPNRQSFLKYKKIYIQYPTRLNAMAIDPGKITQDVNMCFSPGEIVFSTSIFLGIEVEAIVDSEMILVENADGYEPLVKHGCLVMKKLLGINCGFKVKVDNIHKYKHCGFGSSGCLLSAVVTAINEMFAMPFDKETLIKIIARNYGETIHGDPGYLNPVQCIGGSAASGLWDGSVIVICGNNVVIGSAHIPESKVILIGVPTDYVPMDSREQFNLEKENFHKFSKTSEQYRYQIAYEVLHTFLPCMQTGDVRGLGKVIHNYRYNMGSIDNCSYTYSNLSSLMRTLEPLFTDNYVDILSISSIGPAVFAIGDIAEIGKCEEIFHQNQLDTIITRPYNGTYRVLNRE